ncbi:TPA: phage tail protein [Staphylococcus delphini]|nr:phage tail protein [Staphylococcus delphini]HEC2159207.1 phage tail protein [Staphylococcus delphini]HEC2178789.1 phage tail protein [Staphylococcus delphini]HEC2189414.1 phage tail protein [Staphylococcus delphini]HEC2197906.1 phage tail protein [Staphylococcus delphini]
MAEDVHKVKTIFEAHTEKFKKAIDSALKTIERFEKVSKTINDVTLDADASRLNEVVNSVKVKLEALEHEKVTARIEAKNKVEEKVNKAKLALDFINNKRVEAALFLKDRVFNVQIAKVKAAMKKLDTSKINIKLHVDGGVATAKVLAFRARLRSIPNHIKSKLYVEVDGKEMNIFKSTLKNINDRADNFNQRMDALANSIRTFGTVGQYVIRGMMIASFSSLIPIIASAVPVVMAVGNALGVVAGGALGLAGAFGVAGAGLLGFGLMAKTATKMLEKGTIAASEASLQYQASLKDLKSTWQGIVKQNAGHIFYAMGAAVDALSEALESLTPFLSEVANLVDFNAINLYSWVTSSKTAKKAFEALNTTGSQIFADLLNAGGRFGDGLINIFTQFMPLFKFMSQGFQNMAIDFQKWANKVSTENGIQRFIAYTEKNLPVIGKIFGDTFLGIINLFRAFSGNSQDLFQSLSEMTGRFKAWSESVGKSKAFNDFLNYIKTNGPVVASLIGNVVGALLKFVEAMAPIGAVVLQVINTIVQFISNLFEVHPIVAQIIGVLMSLFGVVMSLYPALEGIGLAVTAVGDVLALLAGPVGIVVAILAVLIASFVYLWQTNETFRNKVMEVWNNIVSLITDAINIVWEFVMNVFGTLVSWWNENHDLILQTALTIWGVIGFFITNTLETIQVIVQAVWPVITTVISTAMDIILSVIKLVMQLITGDWSGAWETIKSIGSKLVSGAVSLITNIFNGFVSIVSNIWNRLVSLAGTIFGYLRDKIVEKVENAVTDARNKVNNFVDKFKEAGSNLIMGLVDGVVGAASDLIDAVKDAISGALDWVYDFLDMHSPSRVFKKIGQFMMDGATIGVATRADQFIDSVGDAARRAVDVFNPNLDAVGIVGDLSNVDARLVSNVVHKHQIEERPNQRVVRVEVHLDNDAMTAIVNGKNADNDATFEF